MEHSSEIEFIPKLNRADCLLTTARHGTPKPLLKTINYSLGTIEKRTF